jgi:hypothetical protein
MLRLRAMLRLLSERTHSARLANGETELGFAGGASAADGGES